MYTINDITLNKNVIQTKDGKYYTKEDKTFSYWHYNKNGYKHQFGDYAYDYCFACTKGLQSSVDLLNKLIVKYKLEDLPC